VVMSCTNLASAARSSAIDPAPTPSNSFCPRITDAEGQWPSAQGGIGADK